VSLLASIWKSNS